MATKCNSWHLVMPKCTRTWTFRHTGDVDRCEPQTHQA